ncbi:MAG: very short patch repair endonuclease [Fibrobacteria bacterium]
MKRTDVFSKKKRSEVMAEITSTGNATTELALIKIFKENGIHGWRRHLPFPGKPDFTFPKEKVCVFVHGCFWHGCPKCSRLPKSNIPYWSAKILKNQTRDKRVARKLRGLGFSVFTFWECDLPRASQSHLISRLARALKFKSKWPSKSRLVSVKFSSNLQIHKNQGVKPLVLLGASLYTYPII